MKVKNRKAKGKLSIMSCVRLTNMFGGLLYIAVFVVFLGSEGSMLNDPRCGIRNRQRIVGGNKAGFWPWQVQILKLNKHNNDYKHKCAGTLINKRWVLTTAGCLFEDPYPTFYKIKLGQYDLSKPDPGEVDVSVQSLVIHREFLTDESRANDIALIKLGEDVDLGHTVRPACLPDRLTVARAGEMCYMTGWGRTSKGSAFSNVLQEARLPIVSHDKCAAKNKPFSQVDRWTMVCAGYDDKPTSGCNGDSGGPLVCEEHGRWVLRGLVSWGAVNCDGRQAYSVFTRVEHYIHWMMFSMLFPQRPYSRCRDNHWSCYYWHKKGLCTNNYYKESLRKYCPETCGYRCN